MSDPDKPKRRNWFWVVAAGVAIVLVVAVVAIGARNPRAGDMREKASLIFEYSGLVEFDQKVELQGIRGSNDVACRDSSGDPVRYSTNVKRTDWRYVQGDLWQAAIRVADRLESEGWEVQRYENGSTAGFEARMNDYTVGAYFSVPSLISDRAVGGNVTVSLAIRPPECDGLPDVLGGVAVPTYASSPPD